MTVSVANYATPREISEQRVREVTSVSFVYDSEATQDLALTVPRERDLKPEAPPFFLDNLLPETAAVRELMRLQSGAASGDSFALLQKVGGDVAGAVQVLPQGQTPAGWTAPPIIARDAAIADRILTIKAAEAPGAGRGL